MAVTTVVFALPLPLLALTPLAVRDRVLKGWAHTTLAWLGWVGRVRSRIEGLEQLPTEAGVLLVKHQSTWEVLMLFAAIPRVAFVVKRELLDIPFFGWGLRLLEPIAIDRSAGREALARVRRDGCAALKAGRWVVVFPEGTRVAAGERGKYRSGGAALAAACAPHVVFGAHNAVAHWPERGGAGITPGEVVLRLSPALPVAGRDAAALTRAAEGWIEPQVQALLLAEGRSDLLAPPPVAVKADASARRQGDGCGHGEAQGQGAGDGSGDGDGA